MCPLSVISLSPARPPLLAATADNRNNDRGVNHNVIVISGTMRPPVNVPALCWPNVPGLGCRRRCRGRVCRLPHQIDTSARPHQHRNTISAPPTSYVIPLSASPSIPACGLPSPPLPPPLSMPTQSTLTPSMLPAPKKKIRSNNNRGDNNTAVSPHSPPPAATDSSQEQQQRGGGVK